MNIGGSFEIKDGKRVLKHQTKQQNIMLHEQKIAAAIGKVPAVKSRKTNKPAEDKA